MHNPEEQHRPGRRAACCLALGVVAVVGVGAGCVRTRTTALRAPVTPPSHFSEAAGPNRSVPLPSPWWSAFRSQALSATISDTLSGNLTLRAAWERVAQARAVLEGAESGLRPALTVSGGGKRIRGRRESLTPLGAAGRERVREAESSVTGLLSYEVDLWGRVRSGAEAAELRLRAARGDAEAARLSLSAQAAQFWLQWQAAVLEGEVLRKQLETDAWYERLMRQRYEQGQAGAAEILQQQQHTESTRGALIEVEAVERRYRHALAALAGVPAGGYRPHAAGDLPDLPGFPDAGIPVQVLQRRPDVHAAWLRVRAADRDLAQALADRLPTLRVSLTYLTTAVSPADLFRLWLGTLAGEMAVPLVDGGRRRAAVERSEARRAELLDAYGQAVVEAIREVEDALAAEREARRRYESLRKQTELAAQVLEKVRDRYGAGQVEYLRVLDALRTVESLERRLVGARMAVLSARVALYRALAAPCEAGAAAAGGGERGSSGARRTDD